MADTASTELFQLIVRPIPPDTVASVREEILADIEAALKEKGQEGLLTSEELHPELEKTFPVAELVILAIKAATPIAVWAVNEIIVPKLREKYGVERKKSGDNKNSTGG
jgi:hypothetical protein